MDIVENDIFTSNRKHLSPEREICFLSFVGVFHAGNRRPRSLLLTSRRHFALPLRHLPQTRESVLHHVPLRMCSTDRGGREDDSNRRFRASEFWKDRDPERNDGAGIEKKKPVPTPAETSASQSPSTVESIFSYLKSKPGAISPVKRSSDWSRSRNDQPSRGDRNFTSRTGAANPRLRLQRTEKSSYRDDNVTKAFENAANLDASAIFEKYPLRGPESEDRPSVSVNNASMDDRKHNRYGGNIDNNSSTERTMLVIDEDNDGTVPPELVELLTERTEEVAPGTLRSSSTDNPERTSASTRFTGYAIGNNVTRNARYNVRNLTKRDSIVSPQDTMNNNNRKIPADSYSSDHNSRTDAERNRPEDGERPGNAFSTFFSMANLRRDESRSGRTYESRNTVDSGIGRRSERLRFSAARIRRPYPHSERSTTDTDRRIVKHVDDFQDFFAGRQNAMEKYQTGYSSCASCEGTGLDTCKGCEGDIWLGTEESGYIQCSTCNGIGKGFCEICGGSGRKDTWGFDRSEWKSIFTLPGLNLLEDDLDEDESSLSEAEGDDEGHDDSDEWQTQGSDSRWDGIERYNGTQDDSQELYDDSKSVPSPSEIEDPELPTDLEYLSDSNLQSKASELEGIEDGFDSDLEETFNYEERSEYEELSGPSEFQVSLGDAYESEEESYESDDGNDDDSDDDDEEVEEANDASKYRNFLHSKQDT